MDSARMQVLKAVEDGQITSQEAACLLDAMAGKARGQNVSVRLRVIDVATGRARVDARLSPQILEASANLGLRLDTLWGLPGRIDARAILAALAAGKEGLVAQVADETASQRVEVSIERG